MLRWYRTIRDLQILAEATNRFGSKEDYCLYLMHLKAYEEIAALATGKNVLDLGCNNGWGTLVLSQSARASRASTFPIFPLTRRGER